MFVTDTHPFIWHATNKNHQLSQRAAKLFDEAERGETLIYIPTVVFWEIARLHEKGTVELPDTFTRWAGQLLKKDGFAELQLDIPMIAASISYKFNKDPFDK